MPKHPRSRTASQDFAFQSTDQSPAGTHPFGGAPNGAPAPSQQAPQYNFSTHQRDETNTAPVAPTPPTTRAEYTHGSVGDPSSAYPHLRASSQPSLPHIPSGYAFNPTAWDWKGNAPDFTEYTPHYEPQGELMQEIHAQHAQDHQFSIPFPVADTAYQHSPPLSSAQPSRIQNPLSPPPRPAQRLPGQAGMKRKAVSEPDAGMQAVNGLSEENTTKRQSKSPASSAASGAGLLPPTAPGPGLRAPAPLPASMTAPGALESTAQLNTEPQKRRDSTKGTGPQGRVIDVSAPPRRIAESYGGAETLPSGKVFPIQIGSELFRLSGASISSDAPSYFSHFFGEQFHSSQGRAGDIRTLYIDRDPDTFRDIALHLQGYHVNPRDGEHFVRLFADAQFYSLPRLTKQLFSTDIFIRIGGVPFQIPRDLFSLPGDSPNYFSLGFAQFFSTPGEVFPGLDRNALLRPPSISPPTVPNRSGETFGELVRMLQGYPVEIRNDIHRSQLLRDARYFHLRGLEQKLIPCELSYNLRRGHSEILIRLDDIRQSGVSFTPDTPLSNANSGSGSHAPSQMGASPASKPESPSPSLSGSLFRAGTVSYARPYTDDHANTNILILEISSNESTTLHLPLDPPRSTSSQAPLTLDLRATFHGTVLVRITSLFSVIASKMGLPATQPLGLMMMQSGGGVATQPVSPANSGVSERRVRIRLDPDCHLEIDNAPAEVAVDEQTGRVGIRRTINCEWIWGGARDSEVVMKDGEEQEDAIVLKRAHWKIRVENVDGEAAKMVVVLCGVRLEGYSGDRGRNEGRGFLGG